MPSSIQVRLDAVVIGGDAVGGPSPRGGRWPIVSGLGLPTLYVRGNGERAPDPFEAERLSDQQLATHRRVAADSLGAHRRAG